MKSEEFILETTTAGCVATVASAQGSALTRNASIYGTDDKKKKKKKKGKYKNSIAESLEKSGYAKSLFQKIGFNKDAFSDIYYELEPKDVAELTNSARDELGINWNMIIISGLVDGHEAYAILIERDYETYSPDNKLYFSVNDLDDAIVRILDL